MRREHTTVAMSPTFKSLLTYTVQYRKLRGKASRRLVVEQLILAYAKQLISGMPEATWRSNMITLINECEAEHAEVYQREVEQHERLTARERATRV